MAALIAAMLAPAHTRIAYASIQHARPGVDLARWVRLAPRLARWRRTTRDGIVTLRYRNHRFPRGLFCYRSEHAPGYGLAVRAEHVVAVDLLDPVPMLAALGRELEALEARLGRGPGAATGQASLERDPRALSWEVVRSFLRHTL